MKRVLLAIILILSILSSGCQGRQTVNLKPQQHAAMHWLLLQTNDDAWYCTGYAIAPHVILTAKHCDAQGVKISFDKRVELKPQQFDIDRKYDDGYEHTLMVVPGITFSDYVGYTPGLPQQGDHVHYWGNPERHRDQYRDGYVSGLADEPVTELLVKFPGYYFMLPAFPGDSGSAIFNDQGKIVAIVSAGNNEGTITLGWPLAFTAQQILDAEK